VFAWPREAGEALREEVRALLVDQARGVAGEARALEVVVRLIARLDLSLDHPPSGVDLVARDGAVGGQGEGVGQLERRRVLA
jgi:hypothetical protein